MYKYKIQSSDKYNYKAGIKRQATQLQVDKFMQD